MTSPTLLHGMTVTLVEKTLTGSNAFNEPVYTESQVDVDDVLVGSPTSDELTSALSLHGKTIEYVLGIPDGDEHVWEDTIVIIFGKRYQTIGAVIRGIDDLVPLRWHRKIQVARYEQED